MVEEGEVEAETGYTTSDLTPIDPTELFAHNPVKGSRSRAILGAGMLMKPDCGEAVKEQNEKDSGTACWIQEAFIRQLMNILRCYVDDQFCEKPRSVVGARLPFSLAVLFLEEVFVDSADRLDRYPLEIESPKSKSTLILPDWIPPAESGQPHRDVTFESSAFLR